MIKQICLSFLLLFGNGGNEVLRVGTAGAPPFMLTELFLMDQL